MSMASIRCRFSSRTYANTTAAASTDVSNSTASASSSGSGDVIRDMASGTPFRGTSESSGGGSGFGTSALEMVRTARHISNSQIECIAPPSSTATPRHVEVSINGQQYSQSRLSFAYTVAAAVSFISPASGVVEGGTPVTVFGSGFAAIANSPSALCCRFNATVVHALYVNETTMMCNATASTSGFVAVEV